MGLRLWLPLNGDLTNQGLDDVAVTNDGATVDNNGKIGKCYAFNNTRIAVTSTSIQNMFSSTSQPFTFATWIYLNEDETDRVIIFGNYSANPFVNWELSANGTQRTCVGGSSNYAIHNGGSTAVPKLTWTHIAVVYNGTSSVFYQNGEAVATVSGTNTLTTTTATNVFYIGADQRSGATRLKGKLNDFRLYDTALSAKEIKEISKGLILHYPLNRGGFGNDNLLTNTSFQVTQTQTAWNTTNNGTLEAVGWGGYNSGHSSANYHAHLKEVDGEYVYEYICTSTETWLGISQADLRSLLTSGETYTFSWEQYCVSGSNYINGGLYYYKTGASSQSFGIGYFSGSADRELGKWKKYTYTFTAPTDGDYTKQMRWYIYGMNGGQGTVYLRHPKLEKGSTATPWTPSTSDTLYAAMGLNSGIEYDCSGYGNNGTITGALSYSGNTPRYSTSTYFNGSSYILTPRGSFNWFDFDQCTISAWFNPTVTPSSWSGSIGIAQDGTYAYKYFVILNYGGKFSVGYCGSGSSYVNLTSDYTLPLNEWHHCVAVLNATALSLYVDGELKKTYTIDWGTKPVASDTRVQIAIDLPGGDEKYTGYYSDVRIYTTALPADDVLALYNAPISIANNGVLMTQGELSEV